MLASFNGATRIHVTIGDPIAQVKSPAGVTQGFAARGADAIMIPLQVKPADIDDFFKLAKKLPNLDGIIITVPHKPVAFRHCDTTSERSRVLEVCNVMRRGADDRWCGDMTDGGGFVAALKRNGFDPKGKRALQVGAGGAGSAIALSLTMEGASVTLADLDTGKRDALIARLGRHGHKVVATDKADPAGFDLVVNATPAGMKIRRSAAGRCRAARRQHVRCRHHHHAAHDAAARRRAGQGLPYSERSADVRRAGRFHQRFLVGQSVATAHPSRRPGATPAAASPPP